MRSVIILSISLLFILPALAQKRPLDHAVCDGWQSIGERAISNNGKFVAYTVKPQEGDGQLIIQGSDDSWKKVIPRGYNAIISEDNRYVVFLIGPLFKDVRDARIKKKKADEMPKDSLGIFFVSGDSLVKIPRVRSYKVPEKFSGWLAYQFEKALPEAKVVQTDSLSQLNKLTWMVDSLARVTDSLRRKLNEIKAKGLIVLESPKNLEKKTSKIDDQVEEGTGLVLVNLSNGEEKRFKLVSDYLFSKTGNTFLMVTTRMNGSSSSKAAVLWFNTGTGKLDTIFRSFNDAKSFAFDESGSQVAFVAESDSAAKALRKFYGLWHFKAGMDSANLRVNRMTKGVMKGMTINEFANIQFSRDGLKLFFQLASIKPIKDTSLIDFETPKLDIWHYNDDYLQPQQLKQADQELRRGYTAVLHLTDNKLVQLGWDDAENITLVDEGNANYVLATSTKGNRVAGQWQGFARQSAYLISTRDGSRKPVARNARSFFTPSPAGKYILWYDWPKREWFTYKVSTGAVVSISKNIGTPMFDEDDDHPDDPPPHGLMHWGENDNDVYLYDRYDVWKCDPDGKEKPVNFTQAYGRKNRLIYRYQSVDDKERFIKSDQLLHFRVFNEKNKESGFAVINPKDKGFPQQQVMGAFALSNQFLKAKNADQYLYTKESFNKSPDIYASSWHSLKDDAIQVENRIIYKDSLFERKLSAINPQQDQYNWFTVDLLKWKMFDGKVSEGLLYKPENFDSTKKYPIIFYFYERNSDTRYQYKVPEPVRASINIPYFVSNGYIVFDPNIYYKKGEPGESAYNSVVSAAKFLSKFKWVDSTRMAIQGHSWGGYQVAYLVTRTHMFAAAEAGAPVANMTSAYGGMRWGPGVNRQFQYERTQSRIGATLWDKPELYIRNSPLFRANKITTPLLILDNDQDDAVPWYQGIELFTAMRRLGKKVWLVNYNGEPHGIIERRNRKDWSIRLAQFFDHYLKGAPPARWIREGIPATLKGIDWGTAN